jgi:hypothetical protein
MKTYGGVDVKIYASVTTAIVGGEWPASRPCRLTLGERASGTHWLAAWVDHRAGLNIWRSPARSQSLYRELYPGPYSEYM